MTTTIFIPTATPDFNAALDAFLVATEATIAADYAARYPNLSVPRLTMESGSKYVRIVRNDHGRSVFCFVRIADGAILKAAGWKAPAKHARGSIYVNAGRDAVTVYGAKYL